MQVTSLNWRVDVLYHWRMLRLTMLAALIACLAGCGLVGVTASTATGAAAEVEQAKQAKQIEDQARQQVQLDVQQQNARTNEQVEKDSR